MKADVQFKTIEKKEILSNTCKWLSADCLLMQYWATDVMWTKDMGYIFLGSWSTKLCYGNKNTGILH